MAGISGKLPYLPQARLAIRVSAAALLAYFAAQPLPLPGYWAVITAVVVMQASLGASLKAAFDRLMGTLAGAALGSVMAIAVSAPFPLEMALALLPLAFLAAINPAFRVAPVTALIVLMPGTDGLKMPLAEVALDRVLEILLGNAAGILVSLFVFPARAQTQLNAAAAKLCALNAALMRLHFSGGRPGREAFTRLHADIRASLKECDTAAEEAGRERSVFLTGGADPEPLLRTLYRVRHDLVMIGRAAKSAPRQVRPAALAAAADLVAIGEALAAGKRPLRSAGLEPAIDSLSRAIGRAGRKGDAGELHTLRFAFEQLAANLADLTARAGERAG